VNHVAGENGKEDGLCLSRAWKCLLYYWSGILGPVHTAIFRAFTLCLPPPHPYLFCYYFLQCYIMFYIFLHFLILMSIHWSASLFCITWYFMTKFVLASVLPFFYPVNPANSLLYCISGLGG
jgi:hypothetical protein